MSFLEESTNFIRYTREFAQKYKFEYMPYIKVDDTSLLLYDIGKTPGLIYIAQSHIKEHAIMLYNAICSIITCQFLPDKKSNIYYVYCDSFELKIEDEVVTVYVYYPNDMNKECAIFMRVYNIEKILDILYIGLCNYFRKLYSINFAKEYIIDEIFSSKSFDYIECTLKRWVSCLKYIFEYNHYRINFCNVNVNNYHHNNPNEFLDQFINEIPPSTNQLELFDVSTVEEMMSCCQKYN